MRTAGEVVGSIGYGLTEGKNKIIEAAHAVAETFSSEKADKTKKAKKTIKKAATKVAAKKTQVKKAAKKTIANLLKYLEVNCLPVGFFGGFSR